MKKLLIPIVLLFFTTKDTVAQYCSEYEEMTITIVQLDSWPQECAWQLTFNNLIVAQGDGYNSTTQICLEYTGIYTFSMWFYSKREGSDWGSILRRESGGNPVNTQDYPILTENSTDELGLYTESGGQFYSSGYDMTSLEGTTSWTHMAVVANGTNSKFYITLYVCFFS